MTPRARTICMFIIDHIEDCCGKSKFIDLAKAETVTIETSGLDSFELVQLVMNIEDTFHLKVPDHHVQGCMTLAQLARLADNPQSI